MPYKPFRARRGIYHFLPVRILLRMWAFFSQSSWGMKIVMAAIICTVFGLFLPWITIGDTSMGAFTFLCGGIGWWISIVVIFLCVHMFSYDFHQKIQKSWSIDIDHAHFYIRIGIVIILMTLIVSLCLTGAARSINSSIRITTDFSGLVMTILGGILLCIGGIVNKKADKKTVYNHVFVQGVESEDQDSYKKILGNSHTEEENMKLPI